MKINIHNTSFTISAVSEKQFPTDNLPEIVFVGRSNVGKSSILNALTCWRYGIPAVALMGTGSSSQFEILKRLPVKSYILGLDPDPAGQAGAQRIKHALKGYKLLYKYNIPQGLDINDLDSGVLDLKKSFV